MAKQNRHIKRRCALIASVVACALLLMLMPAELTAPFRVVFTEAVGPVQQVVYDAVGDTLATSGTVSEMFFAHQRDRLLGKEVLRLRNELVAAQQRLELQRVRLESMQKLELKGLAFTAISAPVTAYDSSPMHHSITIGAGSSDGVRKGMAVCALGALVGVIEEVGPWRSRARLITDAGSSIAARLSRTRQICILQGTGKESLSVEWLDRHSDVKPGDHVVTACLGRMGQPPCLIPDGLPLATVVSVGRDPTELHFLSVVAQAEVNLARLEAVEILVPTLARPPR